MVKKFNITGVCIKEKHYMADVSKKIGIISGMIERGEYFTINRPRQFGKTTIINLLCHAIKEDYVVIKISFEGVGDKVFGDEESFCGTIVKLFAKGLMGWEPSCAQIMLSYDRVTDYSDLSDLIGKFVGDCDKPVVLLIDEVDKSSNNRVFLQFLGMLRNKYLAASEGGSAAFHSVVLAGVHDIKNLKLAIRDDSDSRFNSPWNIAAKFEVDMSLNASEIESMLIDYKNFVGIDMDTNTVSALIHRFTSGYPYLVSDICKIIDEKLDAVWTDESVYVAIKIILNEKNTLFDDVIKNIENNRDIKTVVNEMLIMGRSINYNPYAYETGIIYGIFKEKSNRLAIHNMIFEELIYSYILEQDNIRKMQIPVTNLEQSGYYIGGRLLMEKILLRFQAFMYQEYRKEDEGFYESHGRLIFLAYLKPILNGMGFYFVEPETRENKRLDVVIACGAEKFVVELKIWGGAKREEKGLRQLSEYLAIQGLHEGYMVIFNFNKRKQNTASWIEIDDKRIFEVTV